MSAGKLAMQRAIFSGQLVVRFVFFFPLRSREEISEKTAGVEPSAVRAAVFCANKFY